jgi:protein-tyrosine phosphatase
LQGPKEGEVAHFWNMIYHETGDVAVVVMLTQTFEWGKEKCAQYFPVDMEAPPLVFSPPDLDPFVDHGNDVEANQYLSGKVTLLEFSYDQKSRSEIRKFDLTIGSNSKIVWHFFFGGWTDYTKPEGEDREALLQLTILTAGRSASPDNPRIVHCSAGVGRTGTFIALDHLLRELRSGKLIKEADDTTDPVFETVNLLREQRMMMVYNDTQFQFLYDVLKEQALALLNLDTAATILAPDNSFEPTIKGELEPIIGITSTPTGRWSGKSQVSDIDPRDVPTLS